MKEILKCASRDCGGYRRSGKSVVVLLREAGYSDKQIDRLKKEGRLYLRIDNLNRRLHMGDVFCVEDIRSDLITPQEVMEEDE